MTATAEYGARSAELEKSSTYKTLPGLQARMAAKEIHVGNIDESKIKEPTLGLKDADYKPYIDASNHERREYWKSKGTYDEKMEQWKKSVESYVKSKEVFFSSDEGSRMAGLYSKLGLRADTLTDASVQAFYSRYFDKNGDEKYSSNVNIFVSDIVEYYSFSSLDEFKEDAYEIQKLSRIFGEQMSEIIPQQIELGLRLNSEHGKKSVHKDLGKELKPEETKLLDFLEPFATKKTENTEDPPLSPASPVKQYDSIEDFAKGDELQDDNGIQEQQPKKPMKLEERFQFIKGRVDESHKYYINAALPEIHLSNTELNDLLLLRQFFMDVKIDQNTGRADWKVNREVVPYVFELGDESRDNKRFLNAETSTNNDSGLLALAAASAATPEMQSKLYRLYADSILRIHKENPTLYSRWIELQSQEEGILILMNNDMDAVTRRPKKDEKDRLILNADGSGLLDSEEWQKRINSLQRAFAADALEPHHLRWIEFLSHSVDIAKLHEKIKKHSVKNARTFPVVPEQNDAESDRQPDRDVLSETHNQPETKLIQKNIIEVTNPNNLVEQLNTLLNSRTEETQFQFEPHTLVNFIKAVDLPEGLRVKELTAHIQKGNMQHLALQGDIGRSLGGARFDIRLRNNSAGNGITVEYMHLDPYKGGRAKKKEIEGKLRDINGLIRNGINKQISGQWEVAGFHIDEGKIVLDIKPRPNQATQHHFVRRIDHAVDNLPDSENIGSNNVANTQESLREFSERNTLESKDVYLTSLNEAVKVLEGKDGIVDLPDVPTIVISDLHARREFLADVMKYEIKGWSVFDLIKAGKINVVCVGDGMHSEQEESWRQDSLDEEMTKSLGLMKMVMDLKSRFPENFHYLRGNHDDMDERMHGYRKYANESAQVKHWIVSTFGDDFLDSWANFEESIPLMARGKRLVVSHTAPSSELSEQELKERNVDTARKITWTDNTYMSDDELRPIIQNTLQNIGKGEDTSWIIGHREADGKYGSQLNGQLIQINNPEEHIIAYIPNDRTFHPEEDVIQL